MPRFGLGAKISGTGDTGILQRSLVPNEYSMNFDGTDAHMLIGSHTSDLDNIFDGGGTVFFRCTPDTFANEERFVAKQEIGASGWRIEMASVSGSSCKIKFIVDFDVGQDYEAISSTAIGSIIDCFITYDSSSGSNEATIYLAGEDLTDGTHVEGTGSRVTDADSNIIVGARVVTTDDDGGEAEVDKQFDGKFNQLAFWDTELTADEVAYLRESYSSSVGIKIILDLRRNSGAGSKYNKASNLKAWYRFGDGDNDNWRIIANEAVDYSTSLIISTASNTLSGFSAFGGGTNISGNNFEPDGTLGGGGAHKSLFTEDKHYTLTIQTNGTTDTIEVRQQASDGLDYIVVDGMGALTDSATYNTDHFVALKPYLGFKMSGEDSGTISTLAIYEVEPSTHGAMENNVVGDLAAD